MGEVEEIQDWCEQTRVLLKSARRRRLTNPAPARGLVARAKLLLHWRAAQARAVAALAGLGRRVLALPEVQADPRLDLVRSAVGGLPALIPKFGEALADQLDAAAAGGDAAPAARQAAAATIASYRAQLAAVPLLARLEEFSQRRLQLELLALAELDAALRDIEAALAAEP